MDDKTTQPMDRAQDREGTESRQLGRSRHGQDGTNGHEAGRERGKFPVEAITITSDLPSLESDR